MLRNEHLDFADRHTVHGIEKLVDKSGWTVEDDGTAWCPKCASTPELPDISEPEESASPDYYEPFVEVGTAWSDEKGWTIRIEEIAVDRHGTTWVRGQNCPWLEVRELIGFLREHDMNRTE